MTGQHVIDPDRVSRRPLYIEARQTALMQSCWDEKCSAEVGGCLSATLTLAHLGVGLQCR